MNFRERVLAEANYIISSGDSIRETAKHFGVVSSTICNDMEYHLPYIDKNIYKKVRKVLAVNKCLNTCRIKEFSIKANSFKVFRVASFLTERVLMEELDVNLVIKDNESDFLSEIKDLLKMYNLEGLLSISKNKKKGKFNVVISEAVLLSNNDFYFIDGSTKNKKKQGSPDNVVLEIYISKDAISSSNYKKYLLKRDLFKIISSLIKL